MAKQRKWKYPITSGTYSSWCAMRGRCLNPGNKAFDYYGGRGVKICGEWVNDFDRFFEDMGERPKETTLDRIDSYGDYTLSNCRWVHASDQQGNQRRSVRVTLDGVTLTLKEWAQKLGVPYYTLWNRIRCHGIAPERALTATRLSRSRPT